MCLLFYSVHSVTFYSLECSCLIIQACQDVSTLPAGEKGMSIGGYDFADKAAIDSLCNVFVMYL